MAENENTVRNLSAGSGGKRGGKNNKGGGGKGGKATPAAPVVRIRPLAEPAKLKKRHWRLFVSFLLMVPLPLFAAVFYLWTVAADQFASTTGFTVRQEETSGAAAMLGDLDMFSSGGSSDSDILYEFIQSQEIVASINARIDLKGIFSQHWPNDPVFALWPDASIEDLLWHWARMVQISFDESSGMIALRVLAFSPEEARSIANEILAESQKMINALNAQARSDVMGYAEQDLASAISRLKTAREALTRFRTETQIVDPVADIQGRMGVLNNLQQQLAQALIDYDILLETSNEGDPRRTQALRRIEVIRERIADERLTFASQEVSVAGKDYPTLMAEFESLTVEREVAEETYRAALTATDAARAEATRQSRYLATYIQPTLPETAEFPQRFTLAALLGTFLLMLWSILALVYYSIRDRR